MTRPTSRSSPGSEDSISPLRPSGSDALDRSSGTDTAPLFLSATGPTSPDGETLLPTPSANQYETRDPQMIRDRMARMEARHHRGFTWMTLAQRFTVGLTSSAEGSPASPSAPPAAAAPRPTLAGSGPSSPVSFAMRDPDGSWLRTYRDCSVQASLLDQPLQRFSGTWPRSGSMRGGVAFEHPTSARPTSESGSSYLHTPTTGDGTPRYDSRTSPGYVRAKPVPNLDAQISDLLPTPTSDHSRGLAQPGTDYQSLPNAVLSLGDHTSEPSEGGKP